MMTGHDFNADNVAAAHRQRHLARLRPEGRPAGQRHPARPKIGNTGGRPAARPDGRLPRQRPRAVLPQRRPGQARFQGRRPGSPQADPTGFRLDARRKLLGQLDDLQRRTETGSTQMHDTAYQRAFRLLTSPEAKEAFDLSEEKDSVRDRYGRNTFGQSCLMARRLIEGGVRYVTVNHFDTVFSLSCWDMHADGGGLEQHLPRLRTAPVPAVRLGVHGPDRDLEQRGLLQGNGRRGAERVRPHAAAQRPRRPRPLPAGVDELPVRRQHPRRPGDRLDRQDRLAAARLSDRAAAGAGVDLPRHGHQPRHDDDAGPRQRPIRLVEAEPIRSCREANEARSYTRKEPTASTPWALCLRLSTRLLIRRHRQHRHRHDLPDELAGGRVVQADLAVVAAGGQAVCRRRASATP